MDLGVPPPKGSIAADDLLQIFKDILGKDCNYAYEGNHWHWRVYGDH